MKNKLNNLLNVEVIITEHNSERDTSQINMISEADTSSLTLKDMCRVQMLNEERKKLFTHADTIANFAKESSTNHHFSDCDSSQRTQIIKSEPLEESFSPTDAAASSYIHNIKTDKDGMQICIEPLENMCAHTGSSGMQEVLKCTDVYIAPPKESYKLPGRISVAQNAVGETTGLLDCNKHETISNESTVKPKLEDAGISQDLSSKKKDVNAKQIYTCSVCKKSFVHYTIFRNHEYQHTKFTCTECGEVCNFRKAFNIHSKLHNAQQQYSCNECGKVFSNKVRFNVHLKTHCKEMPYLCNVCGKSFRTKHLLKHHLQGHSLETPFLCNVCGKKYKTNISLRRHVKGHFAEKKYVCLICRKSFIYSYGLKKHSVVHKSDRPLSCTFCNKTFKRKKALAGHIRTHTGEKPYVCTYCNRSFSFEWNLIQHLRLHTGTKPYVCPVCQEAFTHNVTLRNHVKQHEK